MTARLPWLRNDFLHRPNEGENVGLELLLHSRDARLVPQADVVNVSSKQRPSDLCSWKAWRRTTKLRLREQVEPFVLLDIFLFEQSNNERSDLWPLGVKVAFGLGNKKRSAGQRETFHGQHLYSLDHLASFCRVLRGLRR